MIEGKELEEFLDENFKYIPIEGYKISEMNHKVPSLSVLCIGTEDECLKAKTERNLTSYTIHQIKDNQYLLIKTI